MVSIESLRALFPNHFSRRAKATGGSQYSRAWRTLRLENLRVVGPFWSIVVTVPDLVEGEQDQGVDLTLLSERSELEPLPLETGSSIDLRAPAAFRARPDAIWNDPGTVFKPGSGAGGNSRLSLTGVACFTDNHQKRPALPFVDNGGNANGSALDPQQRDILLRPLADLPEHTTDKESRFLTAMQLTGGVITVAAQRDFMSMFRAALGFGDPDEDTHTLVFRPGGVGFRARLTFPWSDKVFDLWLMLGLSSHDPLRGEIRIWTERVSEADAASLETELDVLQSWITGRGKTAPQWLSVEATRQFTASNLFWPTEPDPKGNGLLQSRADDGVWLTGESVLIRLSAEGADVDADQMTLRLPKVRISGKSSELRVSASETLPEPEQGALIDGARASYCFTSDPKEGECPEVVSFEDTASEGAVTFAVPLYATADRLAEELEISGRTDPSLIWTYAPISQGWIHWPLPHVTTANTYALTKDEKRPVRAKGSLTSGRFQFARAETFPRDARNWSLTITGARAISVDLIVKETGISAATIDLEQSALAFDEALPITPFRQRPEAILPDDADRVLSSYGIDAVTSTQLSDNELTLRAAEMSADLTVTGLKIQVGETGAPQLDEAATATLRVKVPDSDPNWAVRRADFRPWVWMRHEALPTVQLLSLSETGSLEDRPSVNRELAPFVLPETADDGMELHFSRITDMQAGAPVFVPPSGSTARPTAAFSWTDEIGMVPTTLSSAVLFPGMAAGLGTSLTGGWAGLETDLELDLRLDVPGTDPIWVDAKLPPPENSGDNSKDLSRIADQGFLPQSDNGPGNPEQLPPWRAVWSAKNRALALSALDRRQLVKVPNGTPAIADVIGDVSLPVNGVTFSPEIAATLSGLALDTLDHVGAFSIKSTALAEDLVLRGLPDVSDMEGLSLTLSRGNGEAMEIERGTVRAGATEPGGPGTEIMDQLGLTAGPAKPGDILAVRSLTRHTPAGTERWSLVSSFEPLDFGVGSLLITDVAFEGGNGAADLSRFWRDEAGVWPASSLDNAGLETNHLAGFSWALHASDSKPDFVPDGSLYFNGWVLAPKALLKVTRSLNADDETIAVTGAEIACQLSYVMKGKDGPQLIEAGGEVRLILGAGTAPKLDYRGVDVPLGDAKAAALPVPVLQLNTAKNETKAKLNFTIGASSYSFEGTLDDSQPKKRFVPQSDAAMASGTLTLTPQIIEIDTGDANAPGDPPAVTAKLKGEVQLGEEANDFATVALDLEIDLVRQSVTSATNDAVKINIHGASLPCAATLPSAFESDRLALRFASGAGSEELYGWALKSINGSILLRLDENAATAPTVTSVGYAIRTRAIAFEAKLGGEGELTLTYNSLDDARNGYLTGQWQYQTIYKWPKVTQTPDLITWQDGATRHSAFAQAVFEATPFPVSHDPIKPWLATAQVRHTIALATPLVIDAPQEIALYSGPALEYLLRTLWDERDATNAVVPSAPKRNSARPHIQKRVFEALPCGIGIVTLSYLRDRLTDHNAGGGKHPLTAADLSGHFWIQHDMSEEAQHLPLPAFALNSGTPKDIVDIAAFNVQFRRPPGGDLDPDFGPNPRVTTTIHPSHAELRATTPTFPTRARVMNNTAPDNAELSLRAEVSGRIADLTAVLGADNPAANMRALTVLRREGYIDHGDPDPTSKDNPWTILAPAYVPDTYHRIWDLLRLEDRPHALQSTVLQTSEQTDAEPVWRLRVFALEWDGAAMGLLGQTTVEKDPALDNAVWREWAQDLVLRLASHARCALMVSDAIGTNSTTLSRVDLIVLPRRSDRPALALTKGAVARSAQPQMRPELKGERSVIRLGLHPHAIAPVAATSDTPHVHGETQTANRLTTSGHARALRLNQQDQRVLSDNTWIVSREQVAFRPGTTDNESTLRPALPPKSRAANFAAATPISQGRIPSPKESQGANVGEGFVPPYFEEIAYAGRAGAWTVSRIALETLVPNERATDYTAVTSLQAPIWSKSARPLELGENDRTRSSSFEARHVALARQPEALLYGPGVPPSREPVGLDRSPRAAWAMRLRLSSPSGGILNDDWDGSFLLEADDLDDEPEVELRRWTLVSASLEVDGANALRIEVAPKRDEYFLTSEDPMRLSFPAQTVQGIKTPQTMVAALPPASDVRLVLLMRHDGLTRMIAFDLVTGARDRGLPDKPLFVRFDDSAYNDQLGGQVRLDRTNIPGDGDSLVFAADRLELQPSDFVTFVLGRRAPKGAEPGELEEEMIPIAFERRREGEENSTKLSIPGGEGNLVRTEDGSNAVTALRLSALKANVDDPTPALVPGDRLIATTSSNKASVTLRFDIVDKPRLPDNSAFYGLHRMEIAETQVTGISVPLPGNGLTPTAVETVDPVELLRGFVRRRAIYRWRVFERPAPKGSELRYALQKRASDGASWLPNSILAGWVSVEEPTPDSGADDEDDAIS